MRRREVEKELQSIQSQLDSMGERMVMSATSGSNGLGDKLRLLAFRIGCCRAALGTTPNTGSPELPPEIVESFYEFCVNGGWNKETYNMLDAVFTFCTRRQLRADA